MADRNSKSSRGMRRTNESTLSMTIYSAFLGCVPRIRRERLPTQPDDTPFHEMTIGRQLRRAAGQATHAIDEARERLKRSKPTAKMPATGGSASIVLIGSTGKPRRKHSTAA